MPKYKFGDLVYNITEKRSPMAGDEELYIGLEHLDSGSLRVTRWGSKVALKGDKLVMRKGDILFGRRNTYLRRVAIAPHDGLFSAHGMILRAKTERINSEYLPFFIASDYFMDEAIRISVGSLSPTVNWKELKELEFTIPTLEAQEKLTKTLIAANDLKEKYEELLAITDDLVKSQFIELFGDPIENPFGWDTASLTTLGTCKNGMNFGANEKGVEIRCVGVGDVKDLSQINDLNSLTLLSLNELPPKEYLLEDGDIVFVRSNGNKNLVGRCVAVYPHNEPLTFSGFCIRFRRDNENILISYLLHLLKQKSVRAKLVGRGANIQNLNQKMLASLDIPMPPLTLQNEYDSFIQQTDKSKFEIKKAIENTSALIKSLMQQDLTN